MSHLIELRWLVSIVAVGLGAFFGTSPRQAARIWGAEKFDSLAPAQKEKFALLFRIFGILLWAAGLLFAVDSFLFPGFHR